VGVQGGVLVVQAVDVGKEQQGVGADQRGHQRGERVVVADADLLGGDGVVLVDDRQQRRCRAAPRTCCGR
jgi:hypothetical protein